MVALPVWMNAQDWVKRNPILSSGQMGFERETGKAKVGTGSAKWNSLPYFSESPYVSPSSASDIVGGASSSKTARRRQVSDRAAFPAFSRNVSNTTDTQVQQTSSILLTDDVADLSFTFGNFARDSAADMALNGLSSVTVRLGLWDGTSTYPIFWPNGSRDLTLEPGAVATTTPLVFKGRKGQRLWIVRRLTWATVPTYFPAASVAANSGTEVNERGTALTDRTTAYGAFFTRTAGNWAVLPPIAITATAAPGPVVAILGDSIASDGANDYNFTDETAYGWAQGGLADAGIPWVNLGTSSLQLGAHIMSSRAGRAQLFSMFPHAGVTHLLVALSTNDWASGRTSVQILADLATLQTELAPLGVKVVAVTSLPKTNAANNAQLSGETNTFAQRALFNASLRSNNGIGDGYFDLGLLAQSPTNENLWRTDVRAASGITLVSGGAGYDSSSVLLLPGGGGTVATTVTGGVITAIGGTPSYGGWLTDPVMPFTHYRLISSSAASNGIPKGSGATFSYTGIAPVVPTADGTHPHQALTRFFRQNFAVQAASLFTV